MDLKQTLKKASETVWNEMAPVDNRFAIHQVREDSLTSSILKGLVRSKCNQILNIIESPKQGEESEKILGYDFDLWIGTKNQYVRYIIQAKSQRDSYDIDGKYEISKTQRERLENFASKQKYKAIPLYCYYKHLNEQSKILIKYFNSEDQFSKKHLGITLSTTYKVKNHTKISFKDLHTFTQKIGYWAPLFKKKPDDITIVNEILNATVPWFELATLKISEVKKFNRQIRLIRKLSKLHLLLLLFSPDYFEFRENIIPVHKVSKEQIIANCFTFDEEKYIPIEKNFQGKSLIIIESES